MTTPDIHPSDLDLAAFATGTLADEQRIMIEIHTRGCAFCRTFVAQMEHVGGAILDGLPPTPLAEGSLAKVLAQIDGPPVAAPVFAARSYAGHPGAADRFISPSWLRGLSSFASLGQLRSVQSRAAFIVLAVGIAYLASETAIFRSFDDYPASTATTGTVAIGGSTNGNIERYGDADWFKVTLVSGKSYRFDLEGSDTGQGTLQHPVLRLRDKAGQELHSDAGSIDRAGPGWTSTVSYTAPSSGTYHISCEASGKDTGTYKLSALETSSEQATGPGTQAAGLHR